MKRLPIPVACLYSHVPPDCPSAYVSEWLNKFVTVKGVDQLLESREMYRFCTELHSRSRRDNRQAVDIDITEGQFRQLNNLDLYENYDYYGAISDDYPLTKASGDLTKAASDQLGSYDGHHKCDNGISICLLLTTLAGIGVLYFILFTRITMAGRKKRRKRRSSGAVHELDALHQVSEGLRLLDSDIIVDFIFSGT